MEIQGLAITGAETGLEVTGRLRVSSNWLGVKLDGSAGGNGTGVILGKGSSNVRIGNAGVKSNVFADNRARRARHSPGVSDVRVMSGYFGVGAGRDRLAPNGGKDIEVASLQRRRPASGAGDRRPSWARDRSRRRRATAPAM